MRQEQLKRIGEDYGFIAALDQSGGSTPKALATYGVESSEYNSEEEMFALVHEMRKRIMTSSSFSADHILGAILFKETMDRQVNGDDTADYLWKTKRVVPFLKIDNGLEDEKDGVQLMKPMPELDILLSRANKKNIFGTKMRSVIKEYNQAGIESVVDQQFAVAKQVLDVGLVPIIEPEVDIHAVDKTKIEECLKDLLVEHLGALSEGQNVMLKLTLPETDNLYEDLTKHPRIARVVALSGGYSRDEANDRLSRNHGVVASFSRALASDLTASQTKEEFDASLLSAVQSIYNASIA